MIALNDHLNEVVHQMHDNFLKYMYDSINYTASISTLSITTLSGSEKLNIFNLVSVSLPSDTFALFNELFNVSFSLHSLGSNCNYLASKHFG